jgi:hypothetical protein
MTSLTGIEIKIVVFALFFTAIIGAFTYLYSLSPTQPQIYSGVGGSSSANTSSSDPWLTGIIRILPAPFDDPVMTIIGAIFITPIVIMLAYISIRAIKDLVSQWV